jgi:heme/copper-type cytochrome/quinol oxidase subunit 1
MISAGLEGMPRRIFRAQAELHNPAWDLGGALTGIGGTLMFVGRDAVLPRDRMTVCGEEGAQPWTSRGGDADGAGLFRVGSGTWIGSASG